MYIFTNCLMVVTWLSVPVGRSGLTSELRCSLATLFCLWAALIKMALRCSEYPRVSSNMARSSPWKLQKLYENIKKIQYQWKASSWDNHRTGWMFNCHVLPAGILSSWSSSIPFQGLMEVKSSLPTETLFSLRLGAAKAQPRQSRDAADSHDFEEVSSTRDRWPEVSRFSRVKCHFDAKGGQTHPNCKNPCWLPAISLCFQPKS